MKALVSFLLCLLLLFSFILMDAPSSTALAADDAPARITVLAAGDLMCLYGQLCTARTKDGYTFDQCFADIKDKVSSADIAIANLETLVADGCAYTGRAPKSGYTRINAPDSYLKAVKDCGFDVLTTANNHTYDYKADGIAKTVRKLDQFGVAHTGAYASAGEKLPLVVDVKGIKIGIVAMTDVLNKRPSAADAGLFNIYSESRVSADIQAARDAGAEFVIVYMHWGKENTSKLTSRQKNAAKAIANAGADLILGSHSHCVQPMATIKTARGNVPVVYSMGNLISSMSRSINKDSALVTFTLEKNSDTGAIAITGITYLPTYCGSKYVISSASAASASQSKTLRLSRNRTVKVMGSGVAQPE
jgi:poly-gamma-glutamate synthesis protein (capsule biosynthesis protein)